MRLFSKDVAAVAIACLGGFLLFHLDGASDVFVGVPAVYLSLYLVFAGSETDRKHAKHLRDHDEILERLVSVTEKLERKAIKEV